MAYIPNYLMKTYKPLKELAKAYGVRLTFGSGHSMKSFSYSRPYDNHIHINIKGYKKKYLKKDQVFSLFFHELAHIFIYREGKFPLANKAEYTSESEIISLKKTVLQFELYTDNYGKKLMKIWFPDIVYLKNYHTKEERDFLKNHVNTIHKEFLIEKKKKKNTTHLSLKA